MNIVKQLTKNRKEIIFGKNTKEYLILHHTGGSQKLIQSILRYFRRTDYLSTHYIVGREGDIIQYVDDKDVAFHAGKSIWKGRTNLNMHSIGIEIVSNGHDFTDKQREVVVELNKHLMKEYGIPKENVLRHADVAGYRGKWDPGPNFFTSRWGSWLSFQNALMPTGGFEDEKKNAAEWVRMNKISNGKRPDDMITRGEMFIMLQRFWRNVEEG